MSLSRSSREGSPFRVPRSAAVRCASRLNLCCSLRLRSTPPVRTHTHLLLHVHANSPDKSQQLAGHRSDHLLFGLTFGRELAVAAVQAMLGLPGDLLHLSAAASLARRQTGPDTRAVAVSPGCLHYDSAQVRIAGFGDRAPAHVLTTAVFTRDRAAVAHQLPCRLKARDLPELGHKTHRRYLRDTAQTLQSVDYRSHSLRHLLNRRINGVLQTLDALDHVLNL